jgi:RNA-directed DNA polymerase
MGVAIATGASPRPPMDWHAINWRKSHRNVRRLQVRIVKAWQAGMKRKARALQFILTRSHSGRAVAVKRVTENHGKRTAGVDRVLWNTPEKKTAAVAELHHRDYHPQPLKRVYIPKNDGRQRGLSIPTMKDRAMQALHLLALDPIAETTADENSYGFRQGRSTADAISQCYCDLAKTTSAQWILEADIKSCFDELGHQWMLTHIPMDRVKLGKWLKAGYVDRDGWQPTERGAPQGGIISPALCNLTLDGLEQRLKEKFAPTERIGKQTQVHLVRYADDVVRHEARTEHDARASAAGRRAASLSS